MGLSAPPQRGYTDFQRLDNWDSAPLYVDPGTLTAGTISSGVLDVSRYAYLGGYDQVTQGAAAVLISWFSSAAATTILGARRFVVTSDVAGAAQYRLPNLGPYVTVQWTSIAALNLNHNAVLIGTNRVHPLELIPERQQLVNRSNVLVNAGASETTWASTYHAGPIRAWAFTPAAGWTLLLQTLDTNMTLVNVDEISLANGNTSISTVAPAGPLSAAVLNGSGANGRYYLSITPSLTGAL